MNYFLSGDIGGTKTLLQICAANVLIPVLRKSYSSAAYAGLENMLDDFLAEAKIHDIYAACFALAGPVSGRVVKLTNLPWAVDGDVLAKRFHFRHVVLINDFDAVGHGISALKPEDLHTIQPGEELANGVRLVVGAGTGLGVAWMSVQGKTYQVHPSEGGHMDFAPLGDRQCLLLSYLQRHHEHVSYERIVSGPGLVSIFEFIRDMGFAQPSPQMLIEIEEGDAAAVITRYSHQEGEAIARMTVDLFLLVYGAFVGNLALASLPRGGIYIAGGIAAKMVAQIQQDGFLKAYMAKGRFSGLLATMPIHIVRNESVGLMGANLIAQRQV